MSYCGRIDCFIDDPHRHGTGSTIGWVMVDPPVNPQTAGEWTFTPGQGGGLDTGEIHRAPLLEKIGELESELAGLRARLAEATLEYALMDAAVTSRGNDGMTAILGANAMLHRWWEALPDETKALVLPLIQCVEDDPVVWIRAWGGEAVSLGLNMNDTFGYACAETQDVPLEKAAEVAAVYRDYESAGLVAWAAHQRDEEPLLGYQTEKYHAARRALALGAGDQPTKGDD